MKEKLRLGLMLDSLRRMPAWENRILKALYNSDFAHIVIVIEVTSRDLQAVTLNKIPGHLMIKFHEKIDRFIFKDRSSDYKRIEDSSVFLNHLPKMEVYLNKNNFADKLKEDQIREIKQCNLDILLNFGCFNLGRAFSPIPKYGVWSYVADDPVLSDGIRFGFRQVVRKMPVTDIALKIVGEEPVDDYVIFISSESTCHYSIDVTRNRLFWRASLFMPRILRRLFDIGPAYLTYLKTRYRNDSRHNNNELTDYSFYNQAARNFLKHSIVVFRQIIKKITYSDAFRWKLLFKIDAEISFSTSFNTFRELPLSKDKFWADPFVVFENGRYYIFAEEFKYKEDKGHISVLELDVRGNLKSSEKIIERPYHMSYPFIFDYNGVYYMIPETCQNKSIDLYKCTSFPTQWEFSKSIMKDISAVDATLFFYADKWWLFTSIDDTNGISGCSTELFLFFTDDILIGNWTSHPGNPIVSDVTKARPAGKIFIHENKIIRPSQDCSERYGKGFNLNEIITLTETEYQEKLIFNTEPGWDSNLKGFHTFNFANNFNIIDVYAFRKRLELIN